MKKYSKKYNKSLEKIDKQKAYTLSEAIEMLKGLEKTKFNEGIDLSFNLGVDTKRSDQMVRGAVSLPHGTGKAVKVIVFTRDATAEEAKKEGAEHVGGDEMIDKVKGGWIDFDVVIATPDMMKDLSKLGKVLGPKGLMPSPKTGTVTKEVGKAVKEVKKGKVEYKVDRTGNLHVSIGKISFDTDKLVENGMVVIDAVNRARPSASKGTYLKRCVVSSTMSPGIDLDLKEIG